MPNTPPGSNSTPLLNRPLAIVGMACRLPGAESIDAFWDLLRRGGSAIERMPDAKLNRELYYDPVKGRRGKTYSDIGGFIKERELDWSLLPIDRAKAEDWDRCHLTLCEVAATACRDAGWDPRNLPLRNGAVFVGHSGGSTLGGELAYRILAPEYVQLLNDVPELAAVIGNGDSSGLLTQLQERIQSGRPLRNDFGRPNTEAGFAAGIVSHALGLTGPHMSIDAACASSLVALALAAATLQTGQSDIAIVGGASYNKSDSLILFSNAQSCSASGTRPFDEAADGLISSEGYVVVVLKTLERAKADGDRIHAVVHGIGVSSDGRGKSLWAPRKEGQYTAIRRAYSDQVTPASVQMVEAHATSTQVGDATEMEALSQFFAENCVEGQRIPVGSVKSNIGHTLETAGLAGMVKAVLAIQHQTIPPSINVKNLSKSIPWSQIPLYVPHQCEPWPSMPSSTPRRAAVNAFGIGGLNVHVVVEQFVEQPTEQSAAGFSIPQAVRGQSAALGHATPYAASAQEPIAVIGRGVVLPGAANVNELQSLLQTGISQIGSRDGSHPREHTLERFGRRISVPHIGGFVRGFEYDWRKHKVPPKQIAQANPLQFMLLEAGEQALREGRCYEREFDRTNTAVVVGSIFGGDFGNALFAGLRLPELKDHLIALLCERGVAKDRAAAIAQSYEEKFLKINPALLDETGSFTSSTLASRLSKTFDLMGGALAIDCGDVSSFAALQAATQLLQSRAVNQVLCAAAHRSLDTVGIETLARHGCLPGTNVEGQPGYFVGEGVAVVLLKRLSDAQRDGDKIITTIDGIAAGFDSHSPGHSLRSALDKLTIQPSGGLRLVGGTGFSSITLDGARHLQGANVTQSPLIPITGHLQATQGLADLIVSTVESSSTATPVHPVVLTGVTVSGQSYAVSLAQVDMIGRPTQHISATATQLQTPPQLPSQPRPSMPSAPIASPPLKTLLTTAPASPSSINQVPTPVIQKSLCAVSGSAVGASTIWRFAANDLATLQSSLAAWASESAAQIQTRCLPRFDSKSVWRAAIVCDPQSLSNKLTLASKQVGVVSARVPLTEQGIFWAAPNEQAERVAWLFPGQGSQYRGMLDELTAHDPAARRALELANALLADMHQPSFDEIAGHAAENLGEDVWLTQAAMLVADWVMMESLRARGYQPSLVSGHSYGEFAAMLAAGCWDLSGALHATWHRCRAIVEHVPAGFGMLSIQANAERVHELLQIEPMGLSISHINAAQQVVVGGRHAAVVEFAQMLDDAGIGSRVLAVPTAFHTPALAPAQEHFARALQSIDIAPPVVPLLSSVTNRYEADPDQLAANLVHQLVHPIDFLSLSHRLLRDRVGLAVEVGPQQVLTRLLRQNVGDALPVIACDQPKRSGLHQLLCAEAHLELFSDQAKPSSQRVTATSTAPTKSAPQPVLTFDATQRRRERMRSGGRVQPTAPAAPVQPAAVPASTLPKHSGQETTARGWAPVQSFVQNQTPVVAPVAPAPTVPPQSVIAPPSLVQPSVSSSDSVPPAKSNDAPRPTLKFIETFLIDFVVEQTGYPAEIIELDWDIEADLGIDSIKKAQLFGELREFFDFESLQDFSLDNFRTLRDIATLLERTPGKSDWLEQVANDHQADSRDESLSSSPSTLPSAPAEPSVADSYRLPSSNEVPPVSTELSSNAGTYYDSAEADTSSASASPQSNQLAMSEAQLTQFLIDFVVEQTGYPPEIVELDADLEADLGIDSIKKAQLFGELREMFQFSAHPASGSATSDPAARQSLADYRTLRTVLNAMLGSDTSASTPSPRVEPTEAKFTSVSAPFESPVASEVATTVTSPAPLQNAVAIGTRAWPLLNHAEQTVTPEYQAALESNLRALIGRRGHSSTLSETDEAVTIQTDVLRIAELCHVNAASLQRLDSAISSQLNWNCDAHGAIAELTAARWLASGGGDVAGLKVERSGELITVAPAGSAHATAAVHRFTLLCVGGLLNEEQFPASNQCEARQRIAQWISTVPASLSYEECVRELSKVRIAGDWWIKVVDAKTRHFAFAESRGGMTAVQFGQVSEPMSNGHVYPLPVVSIGLDRNADRFTIRHVGDTLHGCCEALELNEAWIAKNSNSASVVSRPNASTNIAARYELQMSPAPQRNAPNRQPEWSGAAMVIGDNPVARQLEARLRNVGVTVTRVAASEDPHALASKLAELSQTQLVKHLFIATPCDADATISLDERAWRVRRNKGIMGIFWLCQRWLNQVIAAGCTDESSLVAISSQGGDFGFSGNMHSAEGGGVGGLLKSILIEGWMQGIRTMPIKVIDTAPQQSPAEIVDCVWRELAVPSYDLEVSYLRGIRHVIRAVPRPMTSVSRPVPRGGTWVCTGGARGITAFVTEELAKRYGLKLHLLGTAPAPQIDPTWRGLDEDGTRRLKASVMTSAREAGQNPIKTWQNTEKALEIDATLRRFASLGIEAHYHCCDVANRADLRRALENVRRISGPIQGVLHGAGVGKDARFDRKQAEKVDQCIAAKVDGSLALMDATQNDPLRYFVGFGSISGRFGANGHTDYSLSNEMLCKQIDWFKRQRPDVKAVGFHWHAWGDVGMATKPETRLALEMIDMQFMPAREGMEHLIAELEGDSSATEVLITDDRYYRAFYPAETLVANDLRSSGQPVGTPMLVERTSKSGVNGHREFVAKVDPSRDPFLTDHKLDGHPLLPFVIASEMLMEAAAACCGSHEKVVLQDIEALQGLRFFSPGARELTVYCDANSSNAMQLGLQCDFLSRDGRLVEANRLHFRAKATGATRSADAVRLVAPETAQWVRAIYPPIGEKFYVGWPFQRLRKVALTDEGLIGKIAAPALIELAGTSRNLSGWQIPCAAMDSCLFAVGALAWQRVAPGTALPIRFGRLEVGRLPSPGEACEVHVRLLSHSNDRACFDFTLYGVDGDVLLNACDYEVAWLQVSSASDAALHAGRGASQ